MKPDIPSESAVSPSPCLSDQYATMAAQAETHQITRGRGLPTVPLPPDRTICVAACIGVANTKPSRDAVAKVAEWRLGCLRIAGLTNPATLTMAGRGQSIAPWRTRRGGGGRPPQHRSSASHRHIGYCRIIPAASDLVGCFDSVVDPSCEKLRCSRGLLVRLLLFISCSFVFPRKQIASPGFITARTTVRTSPDPFITAQPQSCPHKQGRQRPRRRRRGSRRS
jgi:hypothetical protein